MEYYHSEWLNSLIVLNLPSDAFPVDRMIVKELENDDERDVSKQKIHYLEQTILTCIPNELNSELETWISSDDFSFYNFYTSDYSFLHKTTCYFFWFLIEDFVFSGDVRLVCPDGRSLDGLLPWQGQRQRLRGSWIRTRSWKLPAWRRLQRR